LNGGRSIQIMKWFIKKVSSNPSLLYFEKLISQLGIGGRGVEASRIQVLQAAARISRAPLEIGNCGLLLRRQKRYWRAGLLHTR
jgi:hypothetical protein